MMLVLPLQAQQTLRGLTDNLCSAVDQHQVTPLGELPASRPMQLTLMLPLRNQEELASFLARLQDPSSADYRKYLTVDQFTNQYGPTERDYQAVVNFARTHGFTITNTPRNRMLVGVHGTVRQVENALHVTMKVYQHPTENRTFYSPDRAPALEANLPVSHIVGLDNFIEPHSMLHKAAPAVGAHSNTSDFTGSGPNQSLLAEDIRAAYYGNGPLTGTGQAIGLVEYQGYRISDVVSSFYGEASATTNGTNYTLTYTPDAGGGPYTIHINNVLIDGGVALGNDDSETVVDIVAAIGMAPGIAQVIVYNSNGSDVDMFNQMATDNSAKQLSTSWGWGNNAVADDPIFMEFAAQGQTMFVASGDSGAYWSGTPAPFPSDDAYITSVGGTDLVTSGPLGSWVSETGWSQSTGGPGSDGFPLPYYQAGLAGFAAPNADVSMTIRNTPDVAADADTNSYSCGMGNCGSSGGTSLAAPRWAGFMALVNQLAEAAGKAPIGFLNPTLYALAESSNANYTADFHDISIGVNNCNWADCNDPVQFSAGTGYDLVTGWGSMMGPALINALVGVDAPSFMLSSSTPGATIQPGTTWSSGISVTSFFGFNGNVALSTSALPSGVTAVFSPATASATTPSTVTFSTTNDLSTASAITIIGNSGNLTETTSITLAGPATCTPTAIRPSLTLNGGFAWLATATASIPALPAGLFTVDLAVQAGSGGNWSWTGPNSFTSSSQQIGPLTLTNGANTYVATYTNSSGCNSTQTFIITQSTTAGLYLSGPVRAVVAQSADSLPQAMQIQSLNGFTSAATLSVSGLPSGVTAAFSPASVTPAANGTVSSNLTLTASSAAVTGSYTITVTATSDSAVSSATLPVMIVSSAASCAGSLPVTNPYISVNGANWLVADAETVALNSVMGLNMNAEDFNNGTWVWSGPNGYSSISQSNRTIYYIPLVEGLNTFEAVYVEPNNCAVTQSFAITAVSEASPGLMVATPILAIPQGSSGSTAAIVSSLYSFSAPTMLSMTGLPSGVTASFSSSSLTPPVNGTALSNITLTATADAAIGTYSVAVVATSGNQSVSTAFSLTILPADGCVPSVTAIPFMTPDGINWNSQTSMTVPTTALVGVEIQADPFMSGFWYWTGPNAYFTSSGFNDSVTGLPVTAGNNTYFGSFINHTSSCQATATFNFNATTASTFDITTPWPAAAILAPANTWTNTVTVSSVNGFNSPVTLSASGLPSGVTASFSPASVTPAAGNPATSMLTLTASSSPAVGASTISVVGRNASLTNSAPIALILLPPTYTAALSPSSLTFGSQAAGSISPAQTVTLQNTGTGSLSLGSIAVSGVFFQSNSCGTPLAPAASCTIAVTFAPLVVGTATGTLTVTDSATQSTQMVSLTGIGNGTPCTGNICYSGSFTTPGQSAYTNSFTSAAGTINAQLNTPNGTNYTIALINQSSSQVVTSQSGKGPVMLTYSVTAGSYAFYVAVNSGPGAWKIKGSYPTISESFTMAASPATFSVAQGNSGTSSITLTSANGISSAVGLSISSLPSGVTAAFSPASITPAANGTATATLTLTASSSATAGSYALTVTGATGLLTATASINLTVPKAKTTPAVTVTPSASSITTAQGMTATVAVSGSGGVLTPTGAIVLSGGGYSSAATTLSNGRASVSIPAGTLNVGNDTLTATYTPDAGSSSTYTSATSSGVPISVVAITASPTLSPAGGSFNAAQTVAISDSTPGAVVYYTTNGSTPTTSSPVYSGPISVSSAETIEAIATATGYSSSAVTTAVYTITPPAATPAFSVTPGTYTTPQSVSISDSTPGAAIYYTTNGSTPTTASTKYTVAGINVSATKTIKAVAIATGYANSAVASAAYTITPPAPPPTFTPATGTYTTAQTVKIADSAIAGLTIYYTTNGSTPTTASTKYTVAGINVSATKTIQAVAIATGYANSAVASAAYTITPPAPPPTFTPAAGTYTTAQTVKIADSAIAGLTIYYTTNGSTPTTASTKYTAAGIHVSATKTIQAVAIATGYANSAVASAAYTITPPVPPPTFTPAAGTYTTAQTVKIADSAIAGLTIYYTTNGSTPTTASIKYTSPITVSATKTIKAIAVASGGSVSVVASASYTIKSTK
jgi:hypothetical protein